MKLDEAQRDDLIKWNEELSTEETQLNTRLSGLSEEVRLLRTRKNLLENVILRNGGADGKGVEEFKKANLENVQFAIKSKEAELATLEPAIKTRLAHIFRIKEEIDSWLRRSQ